MPFLLGEYLCYGITSYSLVNITDVSKKPVANILLVEERPQLTFKMSAYYQPHYATSQIREKYFMTIHSSVFCLTSGGKLTPEFETSESASQNYYTNRAGQKLL
jgi:hypothetical protein